MKVVGGAVGIGGGSNKPIQVNTAPDPNVAAALTALTDANKALAAQSTAKRSIPTWVYWAGGGVIVLVGGYLLLRRRR